jgi:hypothetical protein
MCVCVCVRECTLIVPMVARFCERIACNLYALMLIRMDVCVHARMLVLLSIYWVNRLVVWVVFPVGRQSIGSGSLLVGVDIPVCSAVSWSVSCPDSSLAGCLTRYLIYRLTVSLYCRDCSMYRALMLKY